MLVLTRKLDESIIIGDGIEVKVLGVEGDQVKLGIDAPRAVQVHRAEIYRAIQDENKQATRLDKAWIDRLRAGRSEA